MLALDTTVYEIVYAIYKLRISESIFKCTGMILIQYIHVLYV